MKYRFKYNYENIYAQDYKLSIIYKQFYYFILNFLKKINLLKEISVSHLSPSSDIFALVSPLLFFSFSALVERHFSAL